MTDTPLLNDDEPDIKLNNPPSLPDDTLDDTPALIVTDPPVPPSPELTSTIINHPSPDDKKR